MVYCCIVGKVGGGGGFATKNPQFTKKKKKKDKTHSLTPPRIQERERKGLGCKILKYIYIYR